MTALHIGLRFALGVAVLIVLPHIAGRSIAVLRPTSMRVRFGGAAFAACAFGLLWSVLIWWASRMGAPSGQYVCGGFGAGSLGGLIVGMPTHALVVWALASSEAVKIGRPTTG
jgi:hypothetical protein